MITRVYMNRRSGEERIHVEIDADDIGRVLADFRPGPGASREALALHRVLVEAQAAFGRDWPEVAS